MKQALDERQIVREAIDRLYVLLAEIPFLSLETSAHKESSSDDGIDGLIVVRHGKKEWRLLVEVKKNAQIRDVRMSFQQIQRYREKWTDDKCYQIFVSQYLSQSIREFCKDEGLGYFDFSGNCRLVFDDVFIERQVPSEGPERKRLKSLFSIKASRVLRRLLNAPGRAWKVQQLAAEAEVSAATVSMVKEKLLSEEYAERYGEAFGISRPVELLMEWSKDYKSRKHEQIEYYGHGDLNELEHRFSEYCQSRSIEYAFTMFSGAKRVAPFTRGVERAYAYIIAEKTLEEVAEDLKLKRVESGGNLRLIKPEDDDVLFGKQYVELEYVVSDVQLYLDLAGHRGRGEENAEFLLEQRIRPKW